MLGLALITNRPEQAKRVVDTYGKYFDKIFITVADKTKQPFYEMQKMELDKVTLSYFKWCDNFGKARSFNQEQIDTDYWMWIDDDDDIESPEAIPGLIATMKQNDLDAIYLLYKYMQNDQGEQIAPHWRERIIRTKSPLKWSQSRCHETLIAPTAKTARSDDMTILHNKTKAQEQASMERNIRLLKLDFEDTKDPRTAMYLGDNLMYLQEFDEALRYFTYLLQNGGWDEDKYRAWLRVADIFKIQGRLGEALNACNAAEDLQPDYPDAYFLKADIYNALDQPKKCYEWVKVAMMKPVPETLSVTDPTLYEYRGLFMGALAALELGKVEEAYKLYQIVIKRSPNYKLAQDMAHIFEEAYYDHEAIKRIKWLLYFSRDNGGNIEKLFAGIPPRILCDPRLNADRAKLLPSKTWPKGSIVYYCGQAAETWGPDTLDKGMGGSEEAVVYLSRELAKLGHGPIVVFNDREEEYEDCPEGSYVVDYKPWTLLNPNDRFDIFIAWRAPENVRGVNARVKIVDLHDTIQPERVYAAAEDEAVKFLVKSKYHRDLYPDLPDDRFVIVGNGIVKEHFNG